MLAAVFTGPRDIVAEAVPDPTLLAPTDAIVRVEVTCVCGSDLWYYRGESPRAAGQRNGHEFVGEVVEVGRDVAGLRAGDFVIAPFRWNDGTCGPCVDGFPSACRSGGIWGQPGADGAQGEYVRVPFAAATLVRIDRPAPDMLPHLLTLSDVLATGHHAAVSAAVRPGSTVAVIGDGAVGLCGVAAAHRLGAERVIALSRAEHRQDLARRLGATDVVAERGDAAIEAVTELTAGRGVDAVLECVGTGQSMTTAFGIARPGGQVGFVGVPHGSAVDIGRMYATNVGLRGGLAPVRAYIDELLPDVLDGTITPGIVFDSTFALTDIAAAYRASDERQTVKALVRPSLSTALPLAAGGTRPHGTTSPSPGTPPPIAGSGQVTSS